MALALTMASKNVFEIGAFDAKTYFSELLRRVQEGAVINISKNGKQVAVLQGKKQILNKEAFEAHQRILARSEQLVRKSCGKDYIKITAQNIKEGINDGRKY